MEAPLPETKIEITSRKLMGTSFSCPSGTYSIKTYTINDQSGEWRCYAYRQITALVLDEMTGNYIPKNITVMTSDAVTTQLSICALLIMLILMIALIK